MTVNKKSLTQHAYLNTVANLLGYAVSIIVWLIANPLLLSFLGSAMFGTWKYCQRLLSFAEAADGRATQALKWTLANKLNSDDLDAKRRDIGCAIGVWFKFLPFFILIGGLITWFSPHFIRELSAEYFTLVRLTCAILVLNIMLLPLQNIPDSILVGMNVRYKGFIARAFGVVLAGSLMVYTAFIGWNIVGVAASFLTANLVQGIVLAVIVKRVFPWVAISKPSKEEFRKFFSLSAWTLTWGFAWRFILLGDVIVLGWATSSETVASYVLTLYSMQMCIGLVGFIVNAAAPGIGGLIGQKQFDRVNIVRGEIMLGSWFLITIIGSMVLLWNYSFVGLWVGSEQFIGFTENAMIVLAVTQLIFVENDVRIIALTLDLKYKVLLGVITCVVSAALAYIFAMTFSSGVVGILTGLILGRGILSVFLPLWLNKFFRWDIKQQLIPVMRMLIIMAIVYGVSMYLGIRIDVDSWLILICFGSVSFVMVTVLLFYLGLSRQQRGIFMLRAKNIKFLNRT